MEASLENYSRPQKHLNLTLQRLITFCLEWILSYQPLRLKASQSDRDSIMARSVNAGWTKMNDYYKRTEDTVVYAAAVVLNPSYKWEYIERVWEHPKWTANAKASVKAFWESKFLLL